MREVKSIAVWQGDFHRQLAAQQRSRDVATFAVAALATAQAINRVALGYVPAHRTKVNGQVSTALDRVKPNGGRIEFDFEIIDDVLRWVAQALYDASPFVSGDYQRGHILLADGDLVNLDGPIPAAQEYCFTNTVPYARRLEVGKTRTGRDFVIQVQPRIYERTAKSAQGRFGNRASITSAFIAPPSSYTLKHDQPKRSFAGGKLRISRRQHADRAAGSAVTVPAIFVKGLGS